MKRRQFIKNIGTAAFVVSAVPISSLEEYLATLKSSDIEKDIARLDFLSSEKPAYPEVKTERGGPRLFLNGEEIYPLFALSTHMYPTIENFRRAGIDIYHPLIGMRGGWLGDNKYDWSKMDAFLGRLLELNPKAYFLPRLQLNTPSWWKEAYPDELLKFGQKTPENKYNLIKKRNLEASECGFYFKANAELWEASYASELWRKDSADMLRDFASHIEKSPLKSRVIGYMPTTGCTGEWNAFGPDYLPDYSDPMRRACGGEMPDSKARLNTTFGLLRDPEKENSVIKFYRKYHDTIADTALMMCKALKEETNGRVLTGVFYGYLLEQVRIQEGGYLSMQKFLDSKYIDYIAGPYSYMPGNVTNEKGIRYTTADGAGNILGNARGVAGDGGFRMLTESLRRKGKLYFSEMDPSTHLDKNPLQVIGGHGGDGSDTASGSLNILQRDLGQVFASGSGGWLYDFGPLNQAEKGWYSSDKIINEISRFTKMGELRKKLDISPVAEIAAIYDDSVFCATEHWLAGKPWNGFAIKGTDFFNHWFLNAQVRVFHRIGAPVDYLYSRDLRPEDMKQYKIIFVVNNFLMDNREADRLKNLFRNSGVTVVWYYAPGFITPEKLDLTQMENLTGFNFKIFKEPGPMIVENTIKNEDLEGIKKFGVKTHHWPRFAVTDRDIEQWGEWADLGKTAVAGKKYDGYYSLYSGTAPLPNPVVRRLVKNADARLWSTEPDIVRATEDAVMIVATDTGKRTLTLPKKMVPVEGGTARKTFDLAMQKGEVKIFTAG